MVWIVLALIAVSFAISAAVTAIVMRLAPALGFTDKPGVRKIHHVPKPLGGGIGIFLGLAIPIAAGLAIVTCNDPPKLDAQPIRALNVYWSGIRQQTSIGVGLLAAMLAMHVMGLIDDKKALGPYLKLVIQLIIITAFVACFREVRVLTVLGPAPSIALTVLWIATITNAFNFLDNMDGLSAGVAAVATTAFLVTTLSIEQWFVAASLALLLGSLLGFLCFNFSPAAIFMGDSGSLLIGLVLGILTIRTTYLQPGRTLGAGWYALLVPLIVMAVPLYDLGIVSIIRISRGKSPFVGDTNHLSHRLVARGMSRRTAVLCVYLMTAATSTAAILLPHVTTSFEAGCLFIQTLLILGLVALLEQGRDKPAEAA